MLRWASKRFTRSYKPTSGLIAMESYGFGEPEFVPKETFDDFQSAYAVVLTRRHNRWKKVIDQGKLVRGSQLKRFCRKGIPSEFRLHIWMTLSGAYVEMEKNPDVYRTASSIQPPKEVCNIIMADLPRTFPENKYFAKRDGQQSRLLSLERVLFAFAVTFPHISYCQGLNYLAATILLTISTTCPDEEAEEKTFWLLHALTHRIVPNYYISGMVDVQVDCLVFEELLKAKVPSVYQILKNAQVDCVVLATKWFICLFADVVPVETVLRIFDCLFYEGDKILFRACIALVKLHSSALVNCQLFPDVVLTFREMTQDKLTLYCHEFLTAMFSLPGSLPKSRIKHLRSKCLEHVKASMQDMDQRARDYKKKQAKLEHDSVADKFADDDHDEKEEEAKNEENGEEGKDEEKNCPEGDENEDLAVNVQSDEKVKSHAEQTSPSPIRSTAER